MKIRDMIKEAVSERDPVKAGRVADILRFRFGLDYDASYELVNKVEPIRPQLWAAMMYEADTLEE